MLVGDPSHHGMYEGGAHKFSQDKPDDGGRWYFSRKEIEEHSPSRRDGIDLKKETYIRKSYCTFLQDLGMRLKVPQVTIATAIIFCHRFFLRQSHAKNDRRTIATVCMFLAGKVEETPRPLKDVILVSYEIIHKKDPAAVQRIKQKEVYEQQKELILLEERIVLATLGFDLNLHHPYKPLVEAIKKFKVAQNALAQVAWNFVNDGLRTSLCLQFKPDHIAAGAIFLAAKFLKVKLPSDGEKVSHWWQEFDVTARQLEEVSNQMLELYEQNRAPPSQASEAEASAGAAVNHRPPSKANNGNEEHAPNSSNSQDGGTTSKPGTLKPASSRPAPDHPYTDNHGGTSKTTQNENNDYGSTELKSSSNLKVDGEMVNQHHESEQSHCQENMGELQNSSRFGSEGHGEEDEGKNGGRRETREAAGELKDKHHGRNLEYRDSTLGQSPQEVIKKIDKDKVKAALEKRRKSRGDITRKTDLMDEDDLIERELEDGIELAVESEKIKRERRQNWSKPSNGADHENTNLAKRQDDGGDLRHQGMKDFENVEDGEVATFDNVGHGHRSPISTNRKRKAGSPLDRSSEGKQRHNHHHILPDDRNKLARHGYSERDPKRHVQENHV
ncbi:cyclin-T1-3-like isoform X1 [Actinidia eriantha]|uniref:cyclin-T1-3-like isoform X1 n=2 Tax=Actinidia eriantha TaxID=165200 RepID=UPI002583F7D1|nr:cyclin-T1-3-like isoform X1 [Actinidia eriantha]